MVLATRVDNLSDEHLIEAYMRGLKYDIKHELFLRQPTSVMEAMKMIVILMPKIRIHTSITLEAKIVLEVIRQPYLNQQG